MSNESAIQTQFNIRVPKESYEAYTKAAEDAGLSLSEWAREVLTAALTRNDRGMEPVKAPTVGRMRSITLQNPMLSAYHSVGCGCSECRPKKV